LPVCGVFDLLDFNLSTTHNFSLLLCESCSTKQK
jgi:hypothetical protein